MNARNTGYTIRRAFRGSVLWLVAYESRPLSLKWSTRGEPMRFESSAAAMRAADKAAREYGAECAVVDPAGNLLQPASAQPAIVSAVPRGAAPPCAVCGSHRDANVHLPQYAYTGHHAYEELAT